MHKKGKENVVADALLRNDDGNTTCVAMLVVLEWLDEIRAEYVEVEDCDIMIKNINEYTNFEWKNDIMWYKGRIYLTPASKFKLKILKESQNSLAARHVGLYKTYYNIRQSFYAKGMNKEIQKYVAKCDICQRNKSENIPTQGCYTRDTYQIKNGKRFRWIL